MAVYPLDLMMTAREDPPGIALYLELLQANVDTLREAYL